MFPPGRGSAGLPRLFHQMWDRLSMDFPSCDADRLPVQPSPVPLGSMPSGLGGQGEPLWLRGTCCLESSSCLWPSDLVPSASVHKPCEQGEVSDPPSPSQGTDLSSLPLGGRGHCPGGPDPFLSSRTLPWRWEWGGGVVIARLSVLRSLLTLWYGERGQIIQICVRGAFPPRGKESSVYGGFYMCQACIRTRISHSQKS